MTKEAYGIPVPRGVPKDWEAQALVATDCGWSLRQHYVFPSWGDPVNCVQWLDRFRRVRLLVAHYSNGRSATVRIDANGNWKTSFGDAG